MSAFSPSAPVPVTVLTGFLGAGKTSFLNRLLRAPEARDTAVIVNEFGEVGIDHLLVETARDGVIELADGCICCTVRGDLVDTLAELVDRVQTGRLAPFRRIVIETTGLADPTPILAMLMAHPVLLQHFALDGVVTLVDAVTGRASLAERVEARRQVACADRLLVTKTDLVPDWAGLEAELRMLNPRAPIRDAALSSVGEAFGCGLIDPETRKADLARWMGEGEHDHHHGDHHHDHECGHTHGGSCDHPSHARPHAHGGVASFSLTHDAPIASSDLEAFLDLLFMRQGDKLLRMKAVVRLREDEARPLVLHGVRTYLHPPVRLPAWPDGEPPRSRLVLIGDGLDERLVRDLFAAFSGAPRIDAPDRAALLENPLSLGPGSYR
ncbi:ATP-binding protein [Aureimonas ureilytica]|uniref:ATP-binding protein n=1 Tax=Aureimonas ureilytica TaxID=401562 RepID=A0A175RQR5_9HYPH|nr:GTP-binding protein [Aureimonas ureilytica]KTR05678.1 ATP-binding protein [Aureimonas ureilytica]